MTPLTVPIRPRDCGLVFGIPLSESEFYESLSGSSGRDWVKHFSSWYGDPLAESLWQDYYVPEVIKPTERLIEVARGLGVATYRECRLEDLGEVAGRHAVLTLVSHWQEDGTVELRSGMCRKEQFAAGLPKKYLGLLDLMICQSIRLADEVKKQHPDAFCLCNAKPARLRPKLLLYGQILLKLAEKSQPYPDVVFSAYREARRDEKN